MPKALCSSSFICSRCLGGSRHSVFQNGGIVRRHFSRRSPPLSQVTAPKQHNTEDAADLEAQILNGSRRNAEVDTGSKASQDGAMSRRLADATEEALLEGGRAGRRAIEEAGFSDELRARLLERVESAKFKSENAAALAEAELSTKVGQGSRSIATSQAWTGSEATEDAVLRMLNDAHKPLKPGLRGSGMKSIGNNVDLRIKRAPKKSSGQRLANARDKTSIYALSKDENMNEKEREEMRKELKERFTPAARAMPNSIRGLAALANERIEDAIARGQFKNIPRGKAIERDARADNPFIDTTEYIMNKMIQRQDIVPPWIEKQQELVKTANNFRGRLRNDWKRHVARTIASRGGDLQDHIRQARLYAESERVHNPKKRTVEQIAVPTNVTDDPVMVKITQDASAATGDPGETDMHLLVEGKDGEIQIDVPVKPIPESPDTLSGAPSPTATESLGPLPAPFRDPDWERAETSYLTLAVTNLNSLARSYNLMAPDLAKKPYYNLEREMKSCFADVAPQVADEILERARKPARVLVEKVGHRPGSVMERFSGTQRVRVYEEERSKKYGFKEFWRELRGGGST